MTTASSGKKGTYTQNPGPSEKANRFRRVPWWRKDKLGWPIERIQNRNRFWWWLRVVLQNIRKVAG